MAPTGGSATSYGILYQLLGAAHWAARLRLSIQRDADVLDGALIVIEPSGGGGDHRISAPGRLIVEQWKTRSGDRTWSVRDVVVDVFPDLYRAVRDADVGINTEYRLVTEGRQGDWGDAVLLFEALRGITPSEDVVSLLDGASPIRVGGIDPTQEGRTQRELFQWIVAQLGGLPAAAGDDGGTRQRKIHRLLAGFRIVPQRSLSDLRREIHDLLELVVEDRGEISHCIDTLLGRLLAVAADGDQVLDPGAFLREAGLPPEHLSRVKNLAAEAGRRADETASWNGYDPAIDVRPMPTWPGDRPIVVITGDPGSGRSWRLAALARALAHHGHVCVHVRSTDQARTTLEEVVSLIWNGVLNRQRARPFDGFCQQLDTLLGVNSDARFCIIVDDVASADVAHDLMRSVTRYPRVRLALGTTTTIVEEVQRRSGNRAAEIVELQLLPFTDSERDDVLSRYGIDWFDVPVDTRATLKQPLLAGLYGRHAQGHAGWRPRFEYELYAKHWAALDRTSDGRDALLRLVAATLSGGPYPWSRGAREASNVTSQMLHALAEAGWCAEVRRGEWAVPHERLLEWAAAEYLHEQWRVGGTARGDVRSRLKALLRDEAPSGARRWTYVLGDVLWMISNSEGREVILNLVADLDASVPGAESSLYGLFASFGPRGADVLAQRLCVDLGSREAEVTHAISESLFRVARADPEAIDRVVPVLLSHARERANEVGLRVLARHPRFVFTTAAWAHVERRSTPAVEQLRRAYALAWDAVRACISERADWLRAQIATRDPSDPLLEPLLGLLANSEAPDCRAVWRDVKRRLLDHGPVALQLQLARCVARFRDESEIERVRSMLCSENAPLRGEAFTTLTRLDVELAVNLLDRKVFDRVRGGWPEWLPEMFARAAATSQHRLRRIVADSPAAALDLANMVTGHEPELEPRTLVSLIEALVRVVPSKATFDEPRLSAALSLVQAAIRPEQLAALREAVLQPLIDRTEAATRRFLASPRSVFVMGELDDAVRVLLKLGADPSPLLALMLRATDAHVSRRAAQWCQAVPPKAELLAGLRSVATGSLTDLGSGSSPSPLGIVAARRAVETLGLYGCREVVAEAVLRHGGHVATSDLSIIVQEHGPLDDAMVALVGVALASDDAVRRRNAAWLVLLSGRVDLVPRLHAARRVAADDADLALATCFALQQLRDASDESLAFLATSLRDPKRRGPAAVALMRSDAGAAVDAIEGYLAERDRYDYEEVMLARHLLRKRTRERLAPTILARLRRSATDRSLLVPGAEILLDLGSDGSARLDARALDAALEEQGNFVLVGDRPAAIRLLSTYDQNLAWHAAVRALDRDRTDAGATASILLDLRPSEAVGVLCDRTRDDPKRDRRVAFARALRGVPDRNVVRSRIEPMLTAASKRTRAAGAMLCGYQGPGFCTDALRTALAAESHELPRGALRTALAQQEDETAAHELLRRVPYAPAEQWPPMLDAFLALAGDPLGDSNNRLPDWEALVPKLPFAMRWYIRTWHDAFADDRARRLRAYDW